MPIPILMYHQIDTPPARGTPMRGMVVSLKRFAAQMWLLKLLGYRGVSMGELQPYLRGEKVGKVVGLTFDDGYLNTLDNAAPVLKKLGFSATCYAVSQRLGGHNDWDAAMGVPQKPLMNAVQLRAWVAAGMEVGAHTRNHLDLTTLDDDTAREEVTRCKHELEEASGADVRHFCYPYGRFNPSHMHFVREAGYQTATTTQRGRAAIHGDFFALPRVLVAQATLLPQFALKILTRYEDQRGLK
ncbi:MAG: polysaccharide deacetylase [Gammaproteobacteria bacterium 28-57-27]|nr:MAG: polysaccharide deacetylase [Gammaproteobacteria bacterium 28-57-27]